MILNSLLVLRELNPCSSGRSLLVGAWSAFKGLHQGDQAYYVTVTHGFQFGCAFPCVKADLKVWFDICYLILHLLFDFTSVIWFYICYFRINWKIRFESFNFEKTLLVCFLSLMAYYPSWVIYYQSHRCRGGVLVVLWLKRWAAES